MYYLPHTKILAIRLVEMQSHDQRYFAYHVKWPTCGNFVAAHGIVLFDSTFWWEIFSQGVVMRNKTRKCSRAQRILLSWYRETPAVMRAQTFSVCAMPQGARPARTNFFLFFITLALTSSLCITKLWRAFTSIERVRTRTVRVRRQVKFTS